MIVTAHRNFFEDPHHIARVFQKVILSSNSDRYKDRLAQLEWTDEYAQLNIMDLVAALCVSTEYTHRGQTHEYY